MVDFIRRRRAKAAATAAAAAAAGSVTVTGQVPAGATAKLTRRAFGAGAASVLGDVIVNAQGVATYGPITLVAGNHVSFVYTDETIVVTDPGAVSSAPIVILADDPNQDCDGTTGLACAIVMHGRGEIDLRLVIAETSNIYAASQMRIMLDYSGLWDVPVASHKGNDINASDDFCQDTVVEFGYPATREVYPDPGPAIAAVFAAAPIQSVVFDNTGPTISLGAIMQFDLPLFLSKVKGVRLQGGSFSDYTPGAVNTGTGDFNWSFGTMTEYVLTTLQANNVPVWAAAFKIGEDNFVGPLKSTGSTNPLTFAHERTAVRDGPSIAADATRWLRASFDSHPVVNSAGLQSNIHELVRGTMVYNEADNERNTFTPNTTGSFYYLKPVTDLAGMQAYFHAIIDAFHVAPVAVPKPALNTFTVTQPTPGLVTIALPIRQFRTVWMVSVDGGAYAAYPTGGITGLAAGDHAICIRGDRYGLDGTSSEAVIVTVTAQPYAGP